MGSSDHDCLTWQYECWFDKPSVQSLPSTYNYWKGDYFAMCEELNEIDWDMLFSNDAIYNNWNAFKDRVTSIVEKHVPTVVTKTPSNEPSWWSSSLAKAIKQKQQMYSTFKCTHLPSDYAAYQDTR